MRWTVRSLPLVLALALALPAQAPAADVDVPKLFRTHIAKIKRVTNTRVLLPNTLPGYPNADVPRLYAFGGPDDETAGWSLSLAAIKPCGANACSIAYFTATPGARPTARKRVGLARGTTGYFRPLSCGGSCSPPSIEWRSRGVLYEFQAKVGDESEADQRAALKRMADQAIRAGGR